MRKSTPAILVFLVLMSFVNANSVTKNDITITSDKDTYYCEPILNDKGECLIKATITVTNNQKSTLNLDGLSTFNTKIGKYDYYDAKTKRKLPVTEQDNTTEGIAGNKNKDKTSNTDKLSKSNKIKTLKKVQLKSSESYKIHLVFWANISGKFNYTVNVYQLGNNNLLDTVVLDPYYNVSINSSNPSWHLINGTAMTDDIYGFQAKVNITAGLSDDDTATSYFSQFAGSPVDNKYLIAGYSFNELNPSSTLHDYTTKHNGFVVGNVQRIDIGDYYGWNLSSNGYIIVKDSDDFVTNVNATYCAEVFIASSSSSQTIIDSDGVADGVEMQVDSDGEVICRFDGDSGNRITYSGTIGYDDDDWHTICCASNSSGLYLYVDGVQKDFTGGSIGVINSSDDMFIGARVSDSRRFAGAISQIGIFNATLSPETIAGFGKHNGIGALNKSITIDPFFDYVINNTADKEYYLRIESSVEDVSTVRLMAYKNMTAPNSTNYLTTTITTGTSYIDLAPLVHDGYNYPFRFWSLLSSADVSVSEMYLFEVGNDTVSPVIHSCQVNDTNITCGGVVRLSCNITDDISILNTTFNINKPCVNGSFNIEANKDGDIWYSDVACYGSYNESKQILFNDVYTQDLGGNTAHSSPNLTVTYTCLTTCTPDWEQHIGICQVNDSRQIIYTDKNACGSLTGLPDDNGTWYVCDYCQENIVENNGPCMWNGSTYTQNVSYTDENYYLCCAITGLDSDCSVLSAPYNSTTTRVCNALQQDFDVQLDDIVYFGVKLGGKEKVYGKVFINDTEQFSCLSYIKTPEGKLIQSNPVYTQAKESTFSVFNREYDDREYFQTSNGLANIYWTKENLVIDGSLYVFGVECSSNSSHKISEKAVKVLYENVSAPITRWFWLKENIVPITLGVLMMVFVVLFVSTLYRGVW